MNIEKYLTEKANFNIKVNEKLNLKKEFKMFNTNFGAFFFMIFPNIMGLTANLLWDNKFTLFIYISILVAHILTLIATSISYIDTIKLIKEINKKYE